MDEAASGPVLHLRKIARQANCPGHKDIGRITDVSFPTAGDSCDPQTCSAMLCRLFKFVLNSATQVHVVR